VAGASEVDAYAVKKGGGARARAWSGGERQKEGAGGGRWLFKHLGGTEQRGEKGGGALWARAHGRGRRRRGGPEHDGRQRGAASNGPRPLGAGSGAVAQQGRAAGRSRRGAGAADRWGRDESRAQCQRQGAGGRGVSEAMWRWGPDRRAQPAQCLAAWIQNGFETKSEFKCFKQISNCFKFAQLEQYFSRLKNLK
jgi:hypothetical protein